MVSRNRRDFLKLCAASVPALVVANGVSAEQITAGAPAQSAYRTPSTLDRYIDPLPIPKPLIPHRKRKDKVQYRVRMVEFKHQMHSQLPPTRAWGYEGQYPGPTFDVMSGVPVFYIIFPVAIPGILSAGIFAFTLSWNEFIYALVFLSSPEQKTVPVGVTSELIRGDVFFWGELMAGALLGSVPVAFVYSFFVEYYVSGITGSVKG